MARIQQIIDEGFSEIEFPTNENLRWANIEWNYLAKDLRIPPDMIYPNPLTKEEILKNYDFTKIDKLATSKNDTTFMNKPPKRLVEYLIKNCKDEMEKARVLFRWLTSLDRDNIDFKDLLSFQTRYYLWKIVNFQLDLTNFFQILCMLVGNY